MPRRKSYARKPRRKVRTSTSFRKAVRKVVLGAAEDKMVCTDTTPQSLVSGTWYSTPCFQIGQGDDTDGRDGNVIVGNYGNIRMALVSSVDRVAFMRIMLVRWKGTKGAFSTANLPNHHLACVTPQMRTHYQVLRDEVIALNPRTTGAAEDSRVIFKKWSFKDRTKKYYDVSNVTTAERGQVYLCALHGSNFGGGTDNPEFDARIEYHFKDV